LFHEVQRADHEEEHLDFIQSKAAVKEEDMVGSKKEKTREGRPTAIDET
jgi:hypothetical protein